MAMDRRYNYIKFLEGGGFGDVYLCQDENKQYVCMKEIPRQDSNFKSVKNEIYILSQLSHPRIIRFIDFLITDSKIRIVMEYAPGGSLREYLKRQVAFLDTELVLNIFRDILMGLEYLHIRHVIHRDLKPENLLISRTGRMKICDFGISSVLDKCNSKKQRSGTPLYLAPELINGGEYDFKTDIWSLGCVLYELCTFKSPFFGATGLNDINDIVRKCNKPCWPCDHLQYSHEIRSICGRMLTFNQKRRISLPEIIRCSIIIPEFYHLYFDYYFSDSY